MNNNRYKNSGSAYEKAIAEALEYLKTERLDQEASEWAPDLAVTDTAFIGYARVDHRANLTDPF